MFKFVFFIFSILSGLRFEREVLLRNRIGASIKLKTCETGSNCISFDDSISKLFHPQNLKIYQVLEAAIYQIYR